LVPCLQENELRYQVVADNLNDVIWTMAIDGSITYVSPSVERVRGFTPEEALAQPVGEILTPESLTQSTNYYLYLLDVLAAGGKPESYRGDQQYRCKDGSTYWGEVFAYPIFNPDGSFKHLLGVTRDVSERRAREEELKVAHAELVRKRDQLEAHILEKTLELAAQRELAEQASKARAAILSNMNHELRTPLNHLIGYSELLKREVADPKSHKRLLRMEQSAQQMLRLVVNLLDAAMLESNQIHITGADFALQPLLDKLQNQVLRNAAGKAMELELDLSANLPTRLHGDGYRIWQVLSELLDNAVKFSDKGPIGLRVSHSNATGKVVNLRFEVQDHGIGISLELQASMFEFFTQGDRGSASRYGGIGLGLGLCQRMVSLMAGEMGFSSEPGLGSRFWVELPLGVAAETTAEASAKEALELRAMGQGLLTLLQNDHEYAVSNFKSKAAQIRSLLGEFVFLFEDSLQERDFTLAADILAATLGALTQPTPGT
jgi:PAS domain S-box-containing protein